jgi:hypothetical protein
MIQYYDDKQAGIWPPEPKTHKKRSLIMAGITAVVHPLVRRHLEEARKNILAEMEGLKSALSQVDDLLKAATQSVPNTIPSNQTLSPEPLLATTGS